MEFNKTHPLNQTDLIVIFDGVCNFCNAFVNFVIDRDQRECLKFASNQSEAGQRLLQQFNVPLSLDTIVLIENGNYYVYSTAILRILRHLSGFWSICYHLHFVPTWIRDGCYRWIAKNRYRWMGRSEICRVPTTELQHRFLN